MTIPSTIQHKKKKNNWKPNINERKPQINMKAFYKFSLYLPFHSSSCSWMLPLLSLLSALLEEYYSNNYAWISSKRVSDEGNTKRKYWWVRMLWNMWVCCGGDNKTWRQTIKWVDAQKLDVIGTERTAK